MFTKHVGACTQSGVHPLPHKLVTRLNVVPRHFRRVDLSDVSPLFYSELQRQKSFRARIEKRKKSEGKRVRAGAVNVLF